MPRYRVEAEEARRERVLSVIIEDLTVHRASAQPRPAPLAVGEREVLDQAKRVSVDLNAESELTTRFLRAAAA
jgi:hypothetical protein